MAKQTVDGVLGALAGDELELGRITVREPGVELQWLSRWTFARARPTMA